jgi:hypothetical protein
MSAEQQLLLQAMDPYKARRFGTEHRVNLFKNILINIRLQDTEKRRFSNCKFPTVSNILVLGETHYFHHTN